MRTAERQYSELTGWHGFGRRWYYGIAQLHQKCKGVRCTDSVEKAEGGCCREHHRRQIYSEYGEGRGRERGGLAHGRTRCRAQETRAIFHHYADTMVGLADSSMFCSFSLLYCPPRPLIFLFHSSCWPCCLFSLNVPISLHAVFASMLLLSLSFFYSTCTYVAKIMSFLLYFCCFLFLSHFFIGFSYIFQILYVHIYVFSKYLLKFAV